MSNQNNNRPDRRDELDIDRLIRSIRSSESEPEEQPSTPPAPRQAASRSQPEQLPVVHPPEEQKPMTRSERDDLDPSVQLMRRQIQAMMADWESPGEASGETEPAPSPAREPVLEEPAPKTVSWQIPDLTLPQVEPAEGRRGEESPEWVIPEEETSEPAPAEPAGHPVRKALFSLPFHRKPKKEEPAEAVPEEAVLPDLPLEEPESPVLSEPAPLEPPPQPEQAQAPVPPADQPREEPVPLPPLPETDRQAFAAGQVITLNLRRSVPERPAPQQEQSIFDQDEDDELEFMLADHARKARQEAEQAAVEQAAAEKAAAEKAAAEQAAAERAAAEKAAAEKAAAEQAAAEKAAAEKAAAEKAAAEQAAAEQAAAEKAAAEQAAAEEATAKPQPEQVLTVQLRYSSPKEERPRRQTDLFDQEDAELESLLADRPREGKMTLEQEAMEEQFTLPKLDFVPELLRTEPAKPEEPERLAEEPPQEAPGAPKPQTERSFDFAEEEDAELESMLSAHAGPVRERVRTQVIPPVPEEVPVTEPAPQQTPDQQETPPPPKTPVPAPAPQPESSDVPEAEEDWEEDDDIADESLLERPQRAPGLFRQLAALAASLLRDRPKKETAARIDGEMVPEESQPESEPAPKVIELPQEKPSRLRKKLEEVEERANDFADAMFQGDSQEAAEEEALHQRAERYIPGTDEEREPPRRRKAKPAPKPKERIRRAPDTSPKELSRIFHSSWKSGKGRLPFQLVLALVLIALGALASGEVPYLSVPALTENVKLSGILLTVGLAGACALGLDTLLEGMVQLFRGKPGLNTLSSIGVFMTLADSLWFSLLGRDGPLPFCGFAALSLWAVAWGSCRKKQGLYLSCQTVAAMSHPQRLTMDQGKWDNKGTFIKETGTAKGFGSQIQEPDGAQRVYRYAAPVMIAACLLFGILAAVGQGGAQQLVWNWSVIFVLATPLSATLAYGIPYTKLVKRLNRSGVILAGWEGVDSMQGEAGIAITDSDLFPEGYVQFNGIKNFGQVSLEKLTGCTASVLREMDTGLAKLFDDLIRTQGGFYRRVDDLKVAEGGFSGLIRGDQVLVGSANYMNLMGVPLKQGYQVRNAVFCVINGQLQGIFALNYSMANSVKPALNALIRGGVNPILATRDFNITPTMLRQRFHLPTDRMEFPPVDRRHLLSGRGQPHNEILAALIYREGLGACTDAILGGRRLRTVVRLNTILAVAASVVGALLGFYLAMMGAYHSLSPLNILFFLVMWLVPTLLISNGVDKF